MILILIICIIALINAQSAISRLFTYGIDIIHVPIGPEGLSTLPYNVPGSDTKFTISPESPEVTVNKDVGRLHFQSNSIKVAQSYQITMEYKGLKSFTSITVDFQTGISGGIVRYLSIGYFESYQFVKGVPLVLPNYLEGVPTTCTVNPPLPAGMVYDSNGLKGSPINENSEIVEYTFRCQNQISVTNTVVFSSSVHTNLLPGIVATYFRYIGPNGLPCQTNTPINAFHTPEISIEVQRIEEQANHPYDYYANSWVGNSDLAIEFGATWVGYLLFPTEGLYQFGTESDDGNWLFVDGEMIMDVSGCRAYNPRVDTIPRYFTSGYHYIVINYFQKNGPNALILYWKIPSASSFVQIPVSAYFYAPKFVFTYSSSYFSYNLDSDVNDLQPIFYDIAQPTLYTISPSPSGIGLSLNTENGRITGRISVTTNNVDSEYKVSVTINSIQFTVSIFIDTKDPWVPYTSYISWAWGIYYKLPDLKIHVFPNNYIDYRLKYLGTLYRAIALDKWGQSSTTLVPGQSIIVDPLNHGEGILGFWSLINIAFNITSIDVTCYHSSSLSSSTKVTFTIESIETCPEGYHRLEVFGFGYAQQSHIGFVFQIEDVGGRILFGASVKNDGFDSRVGRCVVPGTYTVGGVYDNDNINDRPRLEIWVEKVKFTTLYGTAKTFKGTFIVGTVSCEPDSGFNRTIIGEEASALCGTNQIGRRKRTCGFKLDVPGWFNIYDTCRSLVKPTTLHYGASLVSVPTSGLVLNPFIDGDATLYTISPSLPSLCSISNTTGIITLSSSSTSQTIYTIIGTSSAGSVSTKLEIRFNSGSSVNNLINLRFGNNNHFTLILNTPISIPFYFDKGTPTSCKSDLSLPSGLNMQTSGITGLIKKEDDVVREYTITCENSYSKSNIVKISTKIYKTLVSGALASYAKLSSGNDLSCTTYYHPYATANSVVGLVRVEDNIDHETVSTFEPWKGVFTDYREHFYINWVFYVKVDTDGIYGFAVEANKGSQFKIDGGLLIDNWGCGDGSRVSGELILGAGYHLIDINFFNTNGGYGIKVYWKRPNDDNYIILPKENIFHLPAYEFTYKYQKTTYIISNSIETNSPILLDTQITNIMITPNLPTGLNMDSSGNINGIPTVHSNGEFIDYYISGMSSSGKSIRAKISIAIVDYQPPYSFTIRYTGAQKTITNTDLLMFVGRSISLTISANGGVNYYSIVPSVPDGFDFNTNSGILSGTCKSPFDIQFQVGAVNSGGLDKIGFHLKCANSCGTQGYEPIGVEITNNNVLDLVYDIECEVNGEILYIPKPDKSTPSFFSFCFRGGYDLKISGSNYNLYPLSIKFYLLNTQFAEYTSSVGGGQLSTPFNHTIQLRFDTPSLSISPSDYTLYTNEYLSIKPIVGGFYSVAYIETSGGVALPSGITLNTDTLEISGVATYRMPKTSFTLHVGTSTGTNTAIFTIEVTDCESSGKYSLSLIYFLTANISTQSITVKNNGESLQSYQPSTSDTYRYNICVQKGTIQLELGSTLSSSWISGSFVYAQVNGAEVGTYTKASSGSTQSFTLTFPIFAVDPIGSWKYSTVYPGYNWNNVTYDEGSMQTSQLNGITSYGTAALYLRYKILKSTNKNALGTYIRFGHTSGCILYVNSRELYRRNMPSGNATGNTFASATFGQMTDITLFIPQVLFNLEENILGVELHKHQNESPTVYLSFSGNYIISSEECVDLSGLATITSTSGNADVLNPLTNAFDFDVSTNWIESTKYATDQPYVEFSFPTNAYFWIDTYGFLSSSDAMNNKNKNPLQISLEAKDVSSSNHLGLQQVSVVADSQPVTIKMYDEYKLYNSFKFTVTERVNPVADTSIAEVLIRACHKTYCSSTGSFPATLMDSYANITCQEGYVGYRTRYCNNALYPNWGRTDTSHCLPGPPTKLKYPYSQYSFFKGTAIEEVIEPETFSVGAVSFEISPLLPNDLKFDNSTGIISGTPNIRMDAKLFTVTIKNTKGSLRTTLYITVNAYECKAQGLWPNTEINTKSEIDCVGGYIGKRSRGCKNTDPIEWDVVDESGCRIVRRPTVPGKGEVQAHFQLIISSDVIIDSLFFDFFRIELIKLIPTVDYGTIILQEEKYESVKSLNLKQDLFEKEMGMYLAVAVDNLNTTVELANKIFSAPFEFQGVLSNVLQGTIVFTYQYKGYYDYIPDKTNNTLVIALSVTFGLLFAILVTTCVWIRCKNRKTKTRGGSVKLKSSGAAASKATTAAGGSGRSVRSGDQKSARSVRI